jgi:nicotinamidase-related amidase
MTEALLQPADCLFLFVDYQAGLAFGVESIARQGILNNAISLARTAMVFNAPIVASTSASKVYSGPLPPSLQEVMPSVQPIERRNMNAWEDDIVRAAIAATNRKRLSSTKPASPFPSCPPSKKATRFSSLGTPAEALV